ncbi:hypothetical protein Tco_0359233 [Tanacetum coccineum]
MALDLACLIVDIPCYRAQVAKPLTRKKKSKYQHSSTENRRTGMVLVMVSSVAASAPCLMILGVGDNCRISESVSESWGDLLILFFFINFEYPYRSCYHLVEEFSKVQIRLNGRARARAQVALPDRLRKDPQHDIGG